MSTVNAVVRLDLMTVRPYHKQLAFMLVGGAIVAVLLRQPGAALPMAAIYATLIASYPFAIGDKADLATLSATLPVRRETVVVGRYLFALVAFALAQVIGLACMLVIAATSGAQFERGAILPLGCVSFALFALTAGIQVPLYFALGYTRARLLGYIPFFAIFVLVGALAAHLPGGPDPAGAAWLLSVVPLGVGMLLIAASCAVSVRLYGRRRL